MERKIIKYKLVRGSKSSSSEEPYDFNLEINELIRNGYQPLGSVKIVADRGYYSFNQVMVKYED